MTLNFRPPAQTDSAIIAMIHALSWPEYLTAPVGARMEDLTLEEIGHPVVSVVVPAYNPGPFLRETVTSVLGQTVEAWETIVVDDGSEEDLSWVGTLDPRVRLVRQDRQGLAAARNRGIREATGGFVAFLDADDLWLPRKLAVQLDAMTDSSIALVSTGFTIIDAAGNYVGPGFEGYAESYEELLQGDGICASTVMVRREAIEACGGFDAAMRQCEDWDLWLRMAREKPITKVDDVLAHYRVHGENMSRDYLSLRRYSRLALQKQLDLVRECGDEPHVDLARLGLRRVNRLIGTQAFDQARATLRADPVAAARHLVNAFRFAPAYVLRESRGKLSSLLSSDKRGRAV